jgi:hypothetical protein
VGENGGYNLYVFARNSPIGFVDKLGKYVLTMWGSPGTPGECGEIKWGVTWDVIPMPDEDDYEDLVGTIVQHMVFDVDVRDCQGSILWQKTWHYWEAFSVDGEAQPTYPDEDEWWYPSRGICTRGNVVWTGSATYYHNYELLYPPWHVDDYVDENGVRVPNPPWGMGTSYTLSDPGISGYETSNPKSRTMAIWWDCCAGDTTTHLIVSQ